MSKPTPNRPSADHNLLFGILALQMDFIRRDTLIDAMNAWVLDKAKPMLYDKTNRCRGMSEQLVLHCQHEPMHLPRLASRRGASHNRWSLFPLRPRGHSRARAPRPRRPASRPRRPQRMLTPRGRSGPTPCSGC
jgi:hypothetical protein